MQREGEEGEEGEGETGAWVSVIERTLKSTVVGGLLLPLLVVVGDRRVCTLPMASMLLNSLHPLVQLVAQVSSSVCVTYVQSMKVCVCVCTKRTVCV